MSERGVRHQETKFEKECGSEISQRVHQNCEKVIPRVFKQRILSTSSDKKDGAYS